jgi:GntR family transcriptional regulator, arabinose operon transcriptional repressor
MAMAAETESTKYQKIADDLLDKIETGDLPPGSRLPTEADLGKAYGVSRITVIHAVRILQNRNLVYRIRGSGTFVAKRGSGSLSARPSSEGMPFVSAVFPQGEESGAHKILVGIEGECSRAGINVTIHNSKNKPGLEHDILLSMLEKGCAGGIVYPCFHSYNVDAYSELVVKGFPFVLIDRRIEFLRVPFIACDNVSSMMEMVRLVISRGHRTVGFFCNCLEVITSERDRYKGYCDAHMTAGLGVKQELVYNIYRDFRDLSSSFDWTEQMVLGAASDALDYYASLKDRPSCIVAVNDHLAMALLRAALDKGLKVPADLSVTGFDDLHAAAHLEVPITTMRQPFEKIGVEAARVLLGMVLGRSGPQSEVLLPAQIVLRQSLA